MSKSANKSFFSVAFDRIVEARSRQARQYVNGALLMVDDQTLKSYGLDREQIKRNVRYNPF